MTMYGIKSCSSVTKAMKFMKEKGIDFDFVDYKKEKVDEVKIRQWLTQVELSALFNAKGTKYRDLKLKELGLDDEGKIAWMAKENYLIKRPVIEYDGGKVLVGYNEPQYLQTF